MFFKGYEVKYDIDRNSPEMARKHSRERVCGIGGDAVIILQHCGYPRTAHYLEQSLMEMSLAHGDGGTKK